MKKVLIINLVFWLFSCSNSTNDTKNLRNLDKRCSSSGSYGSKSVDSYIVRSCPLGSATSSQSAVAACLSGSSLEHWWVEISAENNEYFIAQFNKPQSKLELTNVDCSDSVDKYGRASSGNTNGDISTIVTFSPSGLKLSDVYNWMQSYNDNYDLTSNNCQHFCDKFNKRFNPSGSGLSIKSRQSLQAIGNGIANMTTQEVVCSAIGIGALAGASAVVKKVPVIGQVVSESVPVVKHVCENISTTRSGIKFMDINDDYYIGIDKDDCLIQ